MKKELKLKLFGPPKVVFNQKDGGLTLLLSSYGPGQP